MDRKEFEAEQAHLSLVYDKLLAMEKELQEQIRALDRKATEDKTISVTTYVLTTRMMRQPWKPLQRSRSGTATSIPIMSKAILSGET